MADEFVVGDYRRQKLLADRLRQNAEQIGQLDPAQATMTTTGPNARTQVNYGGILQNALMPWLQGRAQEKADNEAITADQIRQDALDRALKDQPAGQMSPQQIMKLEQLGVSPQVMKAMMPKEQNETGWMQVLASNPALAPVLVSQGHITQEQADSIGKSFADQRSQAKQDKIDIALAGRAPGQGRESFDEWRRKQDYEQQLKLSNPAKASGSGRGKVDPKAALDTLETNYNELSGMLTDPKAKDQLFSTKQRVVVPSAMVGGEGDNPSILGTAVSKIAQGQESPMAAKLRRMATAASFSEVQKLYPASNSDIKLAQSLQARIGESPESMAAFMDMQKKIIEKARAGVYGAPAGQQEEPQGGGADLGKGDVEILGYE
jgi:hypothetical protein